MCIGQTCFFIHQISPQACIQICFYPVFNIEGHGLKHEYWPEFISLLIFRFYGQNQWDCCEYWVILRLTSLTQLINRNKEKIIIYLKLILLASVFSTALRWRHLLFSSPYIRESLILALVLKDCKPKPEKFKSLWQSSSLVKISLVETNQKN